VGTQPLLKTRVCAALALVAFLTGCGETSDQKAARATVRQFYEALKEKDATKACRLVPAREHRQCLSGVNQIFQRVARSPNPNYFETLPDIGAAHIEGDRASVVVRRGIQRRHVGLARGPNGWLITGSPEAG
jgi:hypothetical protein